MGKAPDRRFSQRARLLRWLTFLVAALTLAAGIRLFQVLRSQGVQNVDLISESIVRPAPELGPASNLLLPDLQQARIVIPGRPHDPGEVTETDRRTAIQRTRTFQVSTNSIGLRGPEIAPTTDEFRILCIGDSITFGWGFEGEESFPALLARELGVEVVNAGVPALKPRTFPGWLQMLKEQFEVDLVLVAARPEHARPDPFADYGRAMAETARVAHPAPLGVLLPPLSTFDVMGSQNRATELEQVSIQVAPIPVLDLTSAFRSAQTRGSGVILEQTASAQRVVRLPNRETVLEAIAPPQGLAPAITAMFEEDHSIAEPLFFDGGHPDLEGLQLFAEEVADWVRANGWLH